MSFMTKTTQRKLFLFGRYSLALLPPKKWLSQLGVKAGDEVTVELDKTKRRLIVRFDNSAKTASPQKPPKTASKNDPDDWQPIPQL